MSFITDMLKETGKDGNKKFSQGRIYTFASVFFYFVVHLIMLMESYNPIAEGVSHVNVEVLKLISNGLYSAMLLFCGYTFGGKFIDVIDKIKGIAKPNEKSE